MKNKTVIIIFIVLLVCMVPVAAYFMHPNAPAKTAAVKPVQIAWIGPLSGDAAIIGVDNLKSIKLALAEYQARKRADDPDINLQYFDDEYNTDKAIQIFDTLITPDSDISAVFITDYSVLNALKGNPRLERVIVIDATDNDQYLASINKHIFLIAKQTQEILALLVDAMSNANATNVALFYVADDDFMPRIAKGIHHICTVEGIQVTLYPYQRNTVNFVEQLKKARAMKSDAYVFLGYDEIGLAVKQTRASGITAPIYSFNTAISPAILKNSAGTINGTIIVHFTNIDGNELYAKNFLKKFKRTYGRYPDSEWVALQAYDAANILVNALLASKDDPPAERVKNLEKFLLNLTDYKGVSGDLTILPNGSTRGIYPNVYTIVNGQPVRNH